MAHDLTQLQEEQKQSLRLAKLENELVELKESGKKPERLRAVKDELRDLRQAGREGRTSEAADGDAVAQPAPIQATATVKEN